MIIKILIYGKKFSQSIVGQSICTLSKFFQCDELA